MSRNMQARVPFHKPEIVYLSMYSLLEENRPYDINHLLAFVMALIRRQKIGPEKVSHGACLTEGGRAGSKAIWATWITSQNGVL